MTASAYREDFSAADDAILERDQHRRTIKRLLCNRDENSRKTNIEVDDFCGDVYLACDGKYEKKKR